MNARYVLVNPSALPMLVDVNRCVAGCERISILLPLGLLDERHMRDEAHCTVLADEVLQGFHDLVLCRLVAEGESGDGNNDDQQRRQGKKRVIRKRGR